MNFDQIQSPPPITPRSTLSTLHFPIHLTSSFRLLFEEAHGVHFVVLLWGGTCSGIWLIYQQSHINDTDSSTPKSCQMLIVSQLVLAFLPTFPLYAEIVSGLSLSRACECSYNSCEFICATTLSHK